MSRAPDAGAATGRATIIVIGASAGGVHAILKLAPLLAPNFPAPILFTLHIGAHKSRLAEMIDARGPNRARTPVDGERLSPGCIYVAPSDRHLLVGDGVARLSGGPKEHHSRPAIDPLFRSAALSHGPRGIGVVLTGRLDDGSAGLRAIKACGGVAIAQDPDEAEEPSMPSSAIAAAEIDHVAPLGALPHLLLALALAPAAASPPAPRQLVVEESVASGSGGMEALQAIGAPSAFSCPDCGGVLFKLRDKSLVRFRCHTGHAYSARSLTATHAEGSDATLWAGLRALHEKESLARLVASIGSGAAAEAASRRADEIAGVGKASRAILESAPGAYE